MTEEQRICEITGRQFLVYPREREVLERLGYPLPTICPEERHRRRFAHRNERKLFKNTCLISGKPLISLYPPESGFKVISSAVWWGSDWDPRDFGREVDFSRPFFPQFFELKKACPRLALLNSHGENSDYCNNTVHNKNCYLVFGGDYNQDSIYSIFCMQSRNVCDVYWVHNGELLYDCINLNDCYNVKYSQDCSGCRDSSFLFDCRSCSDCVCCAGLIGKRFCIFNQQYTEADYRRRLGELGLDRRSGVEQTKTEFNKFCRDFPHREASNINVENSSGDHLLNSKNCRGCFEITGPAEDLYHVYLAGWGAKDLISCSTCGHHSELFYECMGCIDGINYGFSSYAWSSSDILYCDSVTNCRSLFGCTNMHRAEFCILNRQYNERDYLALRDRLIAHMKNTGEWGQFFPIENSVFPYNSTVAQDHFPLSKNEALRAGYRWQDEEIRDTVAAIELPDSIDAVDDSVTQQTLICSSTGRPYRIIPQELTFYRQLGIPLPSQAPETRNEGRLKRRLTLFQSERSCAGCGRAIQTVWTAETARSVLCQECYLKAAY